MRTKTLLLAAAVSAVGAAAAMAQVYSVNVVGFVNVDLKAGWNLVANPLAGTNNAINTVLLLDGTDAELDYSCSLFVFNPTSQSYDTAATWQGATDKWDINYTLPPGEGAFLNVPKDTKVTFVGEVMQGNLTNAIVGNYQIKSSQVPKEGTLEAQLGFPKAENDSVLKFDKLTQNWEPAPYVVYNDGTGLVWDPVDPTIKPGEAFFLQRDPSGSNPQWTVSFTVN